MLYLVTYDLRTTEYMNDPKVEKGKMRLVEAPTPDAAEGKLSDHYLKQSESYSVTYDATNIVAHDTIT